MLEFIKIYFKISFLFFLLSSCIGGQPPSGIQDINNSSNVTTYSIEYMGNGADRGLVPVDNTDYINGQNIIVLGNEYSLEKNGYSFIGWNTEPDGSGDNYTQGDIISVFMSDIVLYANWTIGSVFTLTYHSNGAYSGSVPLDTTNYMPSMQAVVLGNIGNLVKSGHRFVGWNTDPDGTGTRYLSGEKITFGSANIELYAEWEINDTFSVIYNDNGSDSGTVPVDALGYVEGASAMILTNSGSLKKTGYCFAGWNTEPDGSGITYMPGQTLIMTDKNQILYVLWETAYSVNYNSNGADGGSVPGVNFYVEGTNVTLPGNVGGLFRSGYSFGGWNTKKDGTGINYTPGQILTIGTTNVILYAKWNFKPVYSVLYDYNEANGGDVPEDSNRYEEGEIVTVLGNTEGLMRSGYLFLGWNTVADGSGISYWGGDSFAMGDSSIVLYAQWGGPGRYDLTFNSGIGANEEVYDILVQSDDKIIIAGNFTEFNSKSALRVVKLLANGTVDASFDVGTGANGIIYKILEQPDGKILLSGDFTVFNGLPVNRIVRLNGDGSIDSSFDSGTGANAVIKTMDIQGDGKIIVGGNFTEYDGVSCSRVARINTDGSPDSTFLPGILNGCVNSLKLQSNEKVVIAGNFTQIDASEYNRITRLNNDGSVDETFSTSSGADDEIMQIKVLSDDSIILVGAFNSYKGSDPYIAKCSGNGDLLPSFTLNGSGANDVIYSAFPISDGNILIGGVFDNFNSSPASFVGCLGQNGSFLEDFSFSNSADNAVFAFGEQSDGKIIIAGAFTVYNGFSANSIVRINKN